MLTIKPDWDRQTATSGLGTKPDSSDKQTITSGDDGEGNYQSSLTCTVFE